MQDWDALLKKYSLENLIDNTTEEIENIPDNFERLFSIHQEFTWENNLLRIIQSTSAILGNTPRLALTPTDHETILTSADLASSLSQNVSYLEIKSLLDHAVNERQTEIFEAARNLNHKQRGDEIEKIVAQRAILFPAFSSSPEAGSHELQDLNYTLSNGVRVLIDIKTKVVTFSSSPTAYNIDKFLKSLAEDDTVLCFFFIAVDPDQRTLFTRLISVLDVLIIGLTRIDLRWSGRNSRGATQLSGDLSSILSAGYDERIEIEQARNFLQKLIDL